MEEVVALTFLLLITLGALVGLRRSASPRGAELEALARRLRRILVADDSQTILKVVALTFMEYCPQVDAAVNGSEALEALERHDYDLVIADIHMGPVSGYDVCRQVKRRCPKVPVILLCGTFEPFNERQFEACRADEVFKKPFDSMELLRRAAELTAAEPSGAEGSPECETMASVSSESTPPERP